MVLAGNFLGAAAVARTQLERWTENRANSNGFARRTGESNSDYITRVWRGERPPRAAGNVWDEMSESLHGRGTLVNAVRWETHGASADELGVTTEAMSLIQAACRLSLRQVLLCVATDLESRPRGRGLSVALRRLPLALPSTIALREAAPLIWPLTFDALGAIGEDASALGSRYLRDVQSLADMRSPRPLDYSERAAEAFLSRRSRAVATAMAAFDEEREALGTQFDPEALKRREFAYILIGESAGVLSMWRQGPVSDALAVGASALRAGFWLWLEDDDRALPLARTVLEQAARLRTWRLKPRRAHAIEARGPRATPRDWLEAAGWRRLRLLNQSLGEFAHASTRSRWAGAREALAIIQPGGGVMSGDLQTARGDTLNDVAFAFGVEVQAALRADYPEVANATSAVLPDPQEEESQRQVEDWLQRCWDHRGHAFGGPDSRPVV